MPKGKSEYSSALEDYNAWLKENPGGNSATAQNEIKAANLHDEAVSYAAGLRPLITSLEKDTEIDYRQGMPQGELEATKLTLEQQQAALVFFEQIKPKIIQWIKQDKLSSGQGISIDNEIENIQGRMAADDNLETSDITLLPQIIEALEMLKKFEISGAAEIFELLNDIKEKTRVFGNNLEHSAAKQ